MAKLSAEKLEALVPGQAAEKVGITQATAQRYYKKWADEIGRGLESKLWRSHRSSAEEGFA